MQSTDFSIPAFPAFPSTTRYVPLGSLKEAVDRVCCSIDAREGTAIIIGPPGTGKSLLCRLLVQQYQSTHDVVLIGDAPIEDRDAFLRHLLHELGAGVDGADPGDLHLALKDHVCRKTDSDGLLLVIDEAQKLSPDVIETVRMITNIMRDGEPRTFVVLSGGVKLDEILIDTTLEAFTQRVATRCYLHPMNSDETRQYITDTIVSCGGDPDQTITSTAMTLIHQVCSGIPRLVNQIMTQAIDCADDLNRTLITEDVVNRAWAELQQLPSPMVEEPRLGKSDSFVEFGELSEIDDFSSWSPDHSDAEESLSDPAVSNEPTLDKSTATGNIDAEPQLADIEVDSPTANLLEEFEDESALESNEDSQQNEILFGEFDQEEEIVVGSGYSVGSFDVATEVSTELEEVLYREIVTAASGNDDVADEDDECESNSEHTADQSAPVFELDEPQARYDAGTDCGCEEASDGAIQMASLDEDPMPSDDRDILVIEDEIDLRSNQSGPRVDSKQKTISVDFQAMLSRMRSNS